MPHKPRLHAIGSTVFCMSAIYEYGVFKLILEAPKKKKLHEHLGGGGGGGQSDFPPSTFDTVHSIDTIFGTYNKLNFFLSIKRNNVVSYWLP